MSWVGTAVVASAVIGGIGSNMAAGQQAGAANNATQAQLSMFNKTQANLKPYMDVGTSVLPQITAGTQPGGALMPKSYTPYDMNSFMNSPEYQLMMQQNMQGLNASQNASSLHGGANSNNMKSLIDWTQGNTLQGYNSGLNNYIQQFLTGNQATAQQFNTLNTVAGSGQNAAASLGGMSTNVGQSIGQNIIGAGNATAAGTMGVTNALAGGIGQGYNQWLQQNYMNMNTPDPSLYGYSGPSTMMMPGGGGVNLP